jgi:hypothetical protein
MAKVSFVGFQEKVEIPEGFQLLKIEEALESKKSREDLYLLLSDPTQLSLWLDTVKSFDSRPGGKLLFENGSLATCTSINFGKDLSFVADEFGNFSAKVIKGKGVNTLELNFAILTDDVAGKSDEILAIIERLKSQL